MREEEPKSVLLVPRLLCLLSALPIPGSPPPSPDDDHGRTQHIHSTRPRNAGACVVKNLLPPSHSLVASPHGLKAVSALHAALDRVPPIDLFIAPLQVPQTTTACLPATDTHAGRVLLA